MKSSTLAWATCVILVLGQIIFFYAVVSPQLQREQACEQQTNSYIMYGGVGDTKELDDLTKTKEGDKGRLYRNHIDQIAISPATDKNEYRVVVVYHTVDSEGRCF